MPTRNQKKREAWGMAFLPTRTEMETLQLHQMISHPSLNIQCTFRVLLLQINPECCFLQINEKDLNKRVDLF